MNIIQSALVSFMFFTPLAVVSTPPVPPPVVVVEQATTTVKTFDGEVHRLAQKYKQDESLARAIIKCEGKMYKEKGNNKNYNKQGVWWSSDIGWWQINDFYHKDAALKLGLDIYNEWDNIEYGFILLKNQGTTPWNASKYCWYPLVSI